VIMVVTVDPAAGPDPDLPGDLAGPVVLRAGETGAVT